MKRVVLFIGIILLFIASVTGVYMYQQRRVDDLEAEIELLEERLADAQSNVSEAADNEQTMQGSYTSENGVNIVVTDPSENSSVVSPLEVNGTVPGNWSFEAQFNVKLLDSRGKVISQQPATLSGDWMTESMVPFSTVLIFSAPNSDTGLLVLEKANPSGLPENDDSLSIPIKF